MLLIGGHVLGFIECYFDESGTHDGAPAMAVAGFVFQKESAKNLNIIWRSVLEDHGLDHFHMTDCALGLGIFKSFSKEERILIEKKLIQIIKKTAILGLSCAVNEGEYNDVFGNYPFHGSAYTFCVRRLLAEFQIGIPLSNPITECSFFFETGHRSQTESNNLMNSLFANAETALEFKYSSHAFLKKENSPELQAADILAWLTYKDLKNELEGCPRKRRADYESLLELPVLSVFATKQNLINIREAYESEGFDEYYKTGKILNSPLRDVL